VKFLLVAVNAKYIHSNLAVYSMRAYAKENREHVEIAEYTINHRMEDIMKDIYLRKPDVIGLSCYIWNARMVRDLVVELRKLLPETPIWLGGPEVSYNPKQQLQQLPQVTGIMVGEGEKTFAQLLTFYLNLSDGAETLVNEAEDGISVERIEGNASRGRTSANEAADRVESLRQIDGLVFRSGQEIMTTTPRQPMSMDEIPFPYEDLQAMEHKILYYESSRGCPFSCSYCLSSVDKRLRFRSTELVLQELEKFLQEKVPQVKFVDRTFNCNRAHALSIWKYLLEHDNGVTNFHFEISADLLQAEELQLMRQMRPGLIQLEIGVQSVAEDTITAINRKMNLGVLAQTVRYVKAGGNIHQHLDLIAGLPYEGYQSFAYSFDWVYALQPDQLQLGFLKVLTGTKMEEDAKRYGIVCQSQPPYEVLYTKWLSYEEVLRLKGVEEMVELYYNSGQFLTTLKYAVRYWDSPFAMYEALADFYEEQGYGQASSSRMQRYEVLYQFLIQQAGRPEDEVSQLLIYDYCLREKLKKRPAFSKEPTKEERQRIGDFYAQEAKDCRYFERSEAISFRNLMNRSHAEMMTLDIQKLVENGNREEGKWLYVFDYGCRSPLDGNAKVIRTPSLAEMDLN
jgi:radical SAM superfamily enzyme YgiQ (UPF0313 family)